MHRTAVLVPLLLLAALATAWLVGGFDVPEDLRPSDDEAPGLRAVDGAPQGPGLAGRGKPPEVVGPDDDNAGITGDVHGRVLVHESKQPVAGAAVWLMYLEGLYEPGTSRRVLTGRDGTFRVPDITPGTWVVFVTHPRFVMRDLSALEEDAAEERMGLVASLHVHAPAACGPGIRTIYMTPAASTPGRVVDDGGEPVAGAQVLLGCDRWDMGRVVGSPAVFPSELPIAATDAAGRFQLPPLPETITEIVLGARKPGYIGLVDQAHEHPLADGTTLDVHVQRLARLSGRVVEADGRPAAGVRIHRQAVPGRMPGAASIVLDAEGRFDDAGFAPGDVRLDFYRGDPFQELEDGQVEAVAPGEHRAGLVFRLAPVRTVEGRLVDAAGTPLPDQEVELGIRREDADAVVVILDEASTEDDGTFSLQVPTGADGPFVLLQDRHGVIAHLAEGLRAGDPPRDHVGVASRPPHATVQVEDADGATVPRFRVHTTGYVTYGPGDDGYRRHKTTIGRDGVAEVPLLGRAPWMVSVDLAQRVDGLPLDAAGAVAKLDAPPDEPLVLRLLPRGQVRILLRDEADRGVDGATLTVDDGEIVPQGDGIYLLRGASPLAKSVWTEITVPPGFVKRRAQAIDCRRSSLVLRLRRSARITGTVRSDVPLSAETLAAVAVKVAWDGGYREVYESWVRPDADGRFVLDGVPSGERVTFLQDRARLPGDLFMPEEVTALAGSEDVQIPLTNGDSLTIRLVAGGEGPIDPDNVIVGLRGKADRALGGLTFSTRTGPQGVVVFRGIPKGTYDVLLLTETGETLVGLRSGVRSGTTVTMSLPMAGTIRVALPDVPATVDFVTLALGRAIGDGAPLLASYWLPNLESLTEDGSLHHSFEDVAAGQPHDLLVQAHDDERTVTHAGIVRGVVSGAGSVVCRLQTAADIRGRLAGTWSGTVHVVVETGALRMDADVDDETNTFRIEGLPPGRYDVVAWDASGQERGRVRDVAAGATDVVLPLRPAPGDAPRAK